MGFFNKKISLPTLWGKNKKDGVSNSQAEAQEDTQDLSENINEGIHEILEEAGSEHELETIKEFGLNNQYTADVQKYESDLRKYVASLDAIPREHKEAVVRATVNSAWFKLLMDKTRTEQHNHVEGSLIENKIQEFLTPYSRSAWKQKFELSMDYKKDVTFVSEYLRNSGIDHFIQTYSEQLSRMYNEVINIWKYALYNIIPEMNLLSRITKDMVFSLSVNERTVSIDPVAIASNPLPIPSADRSDTSSNIEPSHKSSPDFDLTNDSLTDFSQNKDNLEAAAELFSTYRDGTQYIYGNSFFGNPILFLNALIDEYGDTTSDHVEDIIVKSKVQRGSTTMRGMNENDFIEMVEKTKRAMHMEARMPVIKYIQDNKEAIFEIDELQDSLDQEFDVANKKRTLRSIIEARLKPDMMINEAVEGEFDLYFKELQGFQEYVVNVIEKNAKTSSESATGGTRVPDVEGKGEENEVEDSSVNKSSETKEGSHSDLDREKDQLLSDTGLPEIDENHKEKLAHLKDMITTGNAALMTDVLLKNHTDSEENELADAMKTMLLLTMYQLKLQIGKYFLGENYPEHIKVLPWATSGIDLEHIPATLDELFVMYSSYINSNRHSIEDVVAAEDHMNILGSMDEQVRALEEYIASTQSKSASDVKTFEPPRVETLSETNMEESIATPDAIEAESGLSNDRQKSVLDILSNNQDKIYAMHGTLNLAFIQRIAKDISDGMFEGKNKEELYNLIVYSLFAIRLEIEGKFFESSNQFKPTDHVLNLLEYGVPTTEDEWKALLGSQEVRDKLVESLKTLDNIGQTALKIQVELIKEDAENSTKSHEQNVDELDDLSEAVEETKNKDETDVQVELTPEKMQEWLEHAQAIRRWVAKNKPFYKEHEAYFKKGHATNLKVWHRNSSEENALRFEHSYEFFLNLDGKEEVIANKMKDVFFKAEDAIRSKTTTGDDLILQHQRLFELSVVEFNKIKFNSKEQERYIPTIVKQVNGNKLLQNLIERIHEQKSSQLEHDVFGTNNGFSATYNLLAHIYMVGGRFDEDSGNSRLAQISVPELKEFNKNLANFVLKFSIELENLSTLHSKIEDLAEHIADFPEDELSLEYKTENGHFSTTIRELLIDTPDVITLYFYERSGLVKLFQQDINIMFRDVKNHIAAKTQTVPKTHTTELVPNDSTLQVQLEKLAAQREEDQAEIARLKDIIVNQGNTTDANQPALTINDYLTEAEKMVEIPDITPSKYSSIFEIKGKLSPTQRKEKEAREKLEEENRKQQELEDARKDAEKYKGIQLEDGNVATSIKDLRAIQRKRKEMAEQLKAEEERKVNEEKAQDALNKKKKQDEDDINRLISWLDEGSK